MPRKVKRKVKRQLKRQLWEHQRGAYNFARLAICQGNRTLTIIGRQGCGKTTLAVTLGASLVEDRVVELDNGTEMQIRGILFCAPLDAIVDSFAQHEEVAIPPGPKPERTLSIGSWWAPRSARSQADGFSSWLKIGHRTKPLLAITHHALRMRVLSLPENLAGFVLVLDEVHHAPLAESQHQTVLGRIRDSWIERGGIVVQTSATPWHTDSEMLVYRRSDPYYQISSTDLARAGIGPTRFDVGRVMLPYEAETLQEWLDPTSVDTKSLAKAYALLVKHWEELGRPVTLVRHPDNKHVDPLAVAFRHAGARVFDATGVMSAENRERLHAERKLTTYADRTIDVVLASRRFDEGTDLPTIASVFYLGSPTSLRHVLQVYGRAMRDKRTLAGYPEAHVAAATLRFFVPSAKDLVVDEYFQHHHEDAIAIATYLADYQIGHEVIDSLSDRLKASFVRNRPPSKETVVADTLLQRFILTEHDLHSARAEVRRIMASVSASKDVGLNEISMRDVAVAIGELPQTRRRARLEMAFLIEAGDSVRTVTRKLEAMISGVLEDQREKDRTIAQAERDFRCKLHAIVSEIANDWRDMSKMRWNRKILEIVSQFTGADADQIAQQIRKKALPWPHRHEVAQAVRLYWHRHGTWPKRVAGNAGPYGLKNYTWRQIDNHWANYHLPGKDLEEYGRVYVRGR